MGRIGIDDLEDLRSLRLDDAGRAELLETQGECAFVFSDDGWPSGVIMSFIYTEDRFWLTAVTGRTHADALAHDPHVTIIVSNRGTSLPGRRMVAVRGIATVHDDAETKQWFLERFAAKHAPGDPTAFIRLLDSPNRVVVEVRPLRITASHDSRKLAGDGRGGPGTTAQKGAGA
jgi:hypothetical protein